MKTFVTMLKTELKLSFRGMDMVIFAIFVPLIVLIIIGAVYGGKPAFEGASYTFLDQSFGAIATIAICAGGVMGLPLVISNYRNKKILKRYKVTPVSPAMILAADLAMYIVYSIASLVSLYIVALLFFGFSFSGSIWIFLGSYLLVMLSMFSIGMMVGGVAKDEKQAGVIASILYFPMLIFSGATLPYEVMPNILQRVADIMPLTQGIKLLKASVVGIPTDSIILPMILMIAIFAVCSVVAVKFFKWE